MTRLVVGKFVFGFVLGSIESLVFFLSLQHLQFLEVLNSLFGTGLLSWMNGCGLAMMVWLFSPIDLSVVNNLYPDHLYYSTHLHCTTVHYLAKACFYFYLSNLSNV
jgi:hypothetical protein